MSTFEYQAEIEYIQARHGVDDIRAMEIHALTEAAMNKAETDEQEDEE